MSMISFFFEGTGKQGSRPEKKMRLTEDPRPNETLMPHEIGNHKRQKNYILLIIMVNRFLLKKISKLQYTRTSYSKRESASSTKV